MQPSMKTKRWAGLGGISALFLAIFLLRTVLAMRGADVPRLFEIFDGLVILASLAFVAVYYHRLRRSDWLLALLAGMMIALLLPFATLFSPFPAWGLRGQPVEALARGLATSAAMLAGLAVMRIGGPVFVRLADGAWRKTLKSLGIGILVGLPLAMVNIIALRMTQGRPFALQNPMAAAIDALQPAVVEEAIYRLAMLGILWWVLRDDWGAKAAWIAGALALLVHSYSHLDSLLVENPLFAIVYGGVMALLWGLPITVLALRRDWEAGTAFHWIQDAVRFFAGF